MAEKYRRLSGYNYALNNPIRFIDPDGMDPLADAERLAKAVAQRNAQTDAFNAFVAAGDRQSEAALNTAISANDGLGGVSGMLTQDPPNKRSKGGNQGGQLNRGEGSSFSEYTLRGNDVSVTTLFKEFISGNGPEKSLFRNNHPIIQHLKTAWIIQEAKYMFMLRGGKSLIRFDAPYGILGQAATETTAEQFVGGARITIVPSSKGLFIQVDDTKNNNSLFGHMINTNPSRDSGNNMPLTTTYQRYIWFEPY